MKIIKYTLYFFLTLFSLILVIVVLAFLLDTYKTSYLNIEDEHNSTSKNLFIKNVNIIPMTTDTILYNHQVRIVNGIVESVGQDLEPDGLAVLDAKNGFLTPGLIDMHVHVWDEYELGLYLANGVTTVRNLWGRPMHLRMKEAINNEDIYGPVFFTSGPKLTGPEFIGDDNLNLTTVEEAADKVTSYQERGYDFIKTYYGLTEELFEAVIQRCDELNLDIAAHPTQRVDYAYHFKPRIKTIEHAEEIVQQPLNYKLDTTELRNVVQLYSSSLENRICPTLIVYYNIYRLITENQILEGNEVAYMNPMIRMVDSKNQFNRWQNTLAVNPNIGEQIMDQHEFHLLAIQMIHESGSQIVCGTDAGIGVTVPGFAIHQELQFYLEAGMTNYEALRTATVNPSFTHDFLKDMGAIDTGKHANLILTWSNPLDNLSVLQSPSAVIINGRVLGESKLEEYKEHAKNRNNRIVSALRYLEYLIVER